MHEVATISRRGWPPHHSFFQFIHLSILGHEDFWKPCASTDEQLVTFISFMKHMSVLMCVAYDAFVHLIVPGLVS